MTIALAFALLLPGAMPLQTEPAPTTKRAPTDAARDFRLDALEATPEPAAEPVPMNATPATPATASAGYTLDTPIAALIADPRARAILDRDLPGLSTDKNLGKFDSLSLRRFQPLTGGQLTDQLLAKVAGDLAALDAAVSPAASAKPTARRKPMVGR